MYLNDEKLRQSLDEFNNTSLNFPREKTVIGMFSEQVDTVPNNLAISYNAKELSYKELDAASNQFAKYLVEEHHIQKEDFIGVMLERSEWLIIAILGILKTGSAYVPIDPDYPQKRKEYIQKDSQCKITIHQDIIEDFISKRSNYKTDTIQLSTIEPHDLIYIIYTSGTTGNAKGVMIENKSVVNLISWQTQYFNIEKNERILQFSNYCFDASVEQIFLSLLNGAALFLIDKQALKNHVLPQFIAKNKITHIHATPSYLDTLPDLSELKSLKRVIAGGEVCSLKLAQKLGKACDFYNKYGPTEATVTSTIYKYNPETSVTQNLSIGKPGGNTKAYVMTKNLELVPIGDVGELCITGEGLARGYLNNPELTAEKFIDNPFQPNEKMYRTGDQVQWYEDGTLKFIGRKDDQVKIRGYRIELGEIEAALNSLSSIKRAVVIASGALGNEKQLIAYVQVVDEVFTVQTCREQLHVLIPDFMVPNIFMVVNEFQMNSNGKIDKKNLPQPINLRPESAPLIKKPRNKIENVIVEIWSNLLGGIEIGIDDNFFEMGGTSLLTQKISALIKTQLDLDVPVTKIYQYPTIAEISKFLNLDSDIQIKTSKKRKKKKSTGDIAVIGMACRFPGASSIAELWEVLKNDEETISFFTPEELDKSIPEALRNDPLYVGARGVVPSAKYFDARFFGVNPKLAEAMDPQQRLFLEIAWEVLEQSGHLPKHYDGSVGVYAGTGTNTYYLNNVLRNANLLSAVGDFQAHTVNDKGFIASRTAYHLNLRGPAVSVHSACSTSLLAIAEAVEAIRSGQCDAALAGGTSLTAPINSGHLYQEGSMLSANGHCRSFDAEGKGTIFSDGAGVVLLKGLEDAINDGDIIHAVIKGIGVNNDGGNKGSFTAPSIEGEAGAIINALQDANISPSEISYIEAHGTATPLGDPIEIEGLCLAFGPQPKNGYCAIGSIKSNMGHLTAAAGVAGVIKTILALKHKKIPSSLGYEKANPAIDFENSPFFVNNKLRDWNCEGKRRAGISSFGVGGTNVHIVVEEFREAQVTSGATKPIQLLTWSAKTENSLEGYKTALGNFIKSSTDVKLADVAYSLAITRDTFNNRSFALATDVENAFEQLLSNGTSSIKSSELKVAPSNLAFLFPGQGTQYLQMGKALYKHENVFRTAVDQCSEILLKAFNFDIRSIIYPENNSPDEEERLKDTQFTQPALFVVEYALSQLWMSWGIQPTLLCGHSIGEFVAAHLAGIFSLKDALLLVAIRGKLVSNLPEGSMLSVRTSYENLSQLLPKNLSIAAVNSDQLCVVSGEDKAVEEFSQFLGEKEIPFKLLLTSHAFHSTMMDPVLEEFEAKVKKMTLNVPRRPIISTVTGTWLSDAEATDPKYWSDHLRATVRFSDAMETALGLEDIVLLEVGPGRTLTTLSQQKKRTKSASSIASLVAPNDNENSYHTVLSALGQLWMKGIEPDWQAFYKDESRQKVWLPAYVFDRKLCWVDPPTIDLVTPDFKILTEPNSNQSIQTKTQMNTAPQPNRKALILEKISDIILNTSGMELESSEHGNSFLELGLDSLVLTQMAITCRNEFNAAITFRQLNDDLGTPILLANYLDEILPPERFAPAPVAPAPIVAPVNMPIQNTIPQASMPIQALNHANYSGVVYSNSSAAIDLIAQQLQLLGRQLELLKGNNQMPVAPTSAPIPPTFNETPKQEIQPILNPPAETLSEDEIKEHKKPFGISPKIEKQATAINSKQEAFLKELTASYNKRTAGSKAYTQKHRKHMSDPRVVSGFKPLTKELVYPLVVERSSGSRLWDIDGSEYLDTQNGFGSCLFGYQPDFIKEALHQQIERGFEVGPQHPLAGEVCELLCELTNHERAALCNTGSEAVLGAMRIARTVTGRSLIVAFSKSYHGITDEVIVRGSRMKKTFPAAPGIMPEAVQNMLILDYGTEETLQIIRERAHEFAAVLVEPIQSRRPEFQPVEFLREIREITKAANTTLIFDEIITGFRMHPQGIQGMFGIKADIATYGKVIGGGISIGAIVGSSKYMDALDGGHWQFGDNSFPEVGVTYFAGTFVRHPLALASTKASLLHLRESGPELQDSLAAMTNHLATELNTFFKSRNLPIEIHYFRSLWRLTFLEEIPYSELLFVLMRLKGIHIWDGFACYLTAAYKKEDITHLVNCFIESIDKLTEVGILESNTSEDSNLNYKSSAVLNQPPQPGAKLGLDELGNPNWYIEDEKNEGTYQKIEL